MRESHHARHTFWFWPGPLTSPSNGKWIISKSSPQGTSADCFSYCKTGKSRQSRCIFLNSSHFWLLNCKVCSSCFVKKWLWFCCSWTCNSVYLLVVPVICTDLSLYLDQCQASLGLHWRKLFCVIMIWKHFRKGCVGI